MTAFLFSQSSFPLSCNFSLALSDFGHSERKRAKPLFFGRHFVDNGAECITPAEENDIIVKVAHCQ